MTLPETKHATKYILKNTCWETLKNFHQQILSCLRERNKAVSQPGSRSTAGGFLGWPWWLQCNQLKGLVIKSTDTTVRQ